jgi:RNA recognition motif. (a.k.a. RRM, RBD, or RNP domain)
MTTLYVGNLPFNATEADVKTLFERHGKVDSVKLINDRETGKPRGFERGTGGDPGAERLSDERPPTARE